MKLWKFNRTDVVITLKNGVTVRGFVEDFVTPLTMQRRWTPCFVDVDEILSISVT